MMYLFLLVFCLVNISTFLFLAIVFFVSNNKFIIMYVQLKVLKLGIRYPTLVSRLNRWFWFASSTEYKCYVLFANLNCFKF